MKYLKYVLLLLLSVPAASAPQENHHQQQSSKLTNKLEKIANHLLLSEENMPTVIFFYADWCSLSQKSLSAADQLHRDFTKQVKIHYLDISSRNPMIAHLAIRYFHVSSLPQFLLFDREGNLVSRKIGSVNFDELSAILTSIINKNAATNEKISGSNSQEAVSDNL